MVAHTAKWLPGRKGLLAPVWINSVDWSERKMYVTLTKEQIKTSPEYDASMPLEEEYEKGLSEHYELPIHRGIGPL
jgi:hypothetical protein